MMNRPTKFLLVVSTSAIAGASLALTFVSTAGAAEECLAKPKAGTPQGQHWHYRTDRSTKRQCWYLRDKDDASSQDAQPGPSDKAASLDRKNETPLTRSAADAYAALSPTGSRSESGPQTQPMTQTPAVDARTDEQVPSHDDAPTSEQSPVTTRWPDSTGVLSPTIERPRTSSFVVASATPDPTTAADPATSVTDVSTTANTSSAAVSLQMLFLAAFGALAFSGLTGGALYFARVRHRQQPDDAMGRWKGWAPPDDAYRLYAPKGQARPTNSPRRSEAQSADQPTSGLSENEQEIAQLLARFANQAEAER